MTYEELKVTEDKLLTQLRHCNKWNSTYRGVNFEINNFNLGDISNWTYYLVVLVKQLDEETLPKFVLDKEIVKFGGVDTDYFDYSSAPIISDLDWHVGITYYHKETNDNGELVAIKLGCDYAHLWDEGKNYQLIDVLRDCMHSIDKLIEFIPDLKIRCAYDGKFYHPSEMILIPQGFLMRIANIPKREMEIKKLKSEFNLDEGEI